MSIHRGTLMEKKPLNIVVKDARDGATRLNEYVEKGAFKFDFGVNKEYVITVTKNSDGTKKEEKEPRYRLIGFMDMYVGQELESLNLVRNDLKEIKKERAEMNRTLNVMRKSAFAPISILLLCIALFMLVFGILTLAGILPIPPEQRGFAVVLVILGTLSLAGSIVLAVFRGKKKNALLAREGEIVNQDNQLQAREKEIDSRVPQWYKDALWSNEGTSVLKNATQKHTLK